MEPDRRLGHVQGHAHRQGALLIQRPACAEDAGAIAVLAGLRDYLVGEVRIRGHLAALAGRTGELLLVLVDDMETGRGWLQAQRGMLLASGERAERVGLVVDSGCRGRGLGRQLLGAAEASAPAQGLPELVVRINSRRDGAHAFYLCLGYRAHKSGQVYRYRLDDALPPAPEPGWAPFPRGSSLCDGSVVTVSAVVYA